MRSRPNAAGYRSADGEEARGTFRRIFKCCFTTADGEPHPRPSRRLYIPRHAERDALRSFRPPLPVLPRELRCAKSDFLMDRLRPEPTESRSDSLVPNAGQMLSYQYKGLQQFMGRKNASTTDTSDRGASDLLGAPLNVNMALAARTMPQFGTPAGLADKSVFSHAMSEPTQFPFVVNDPRLTQRGNQGRKLVLSLKTDLSSSNDSHTTAAVTGETLLGDYVLSSQGGVSPTRSPALHLAAQRNLIMDKDHVYFRHGHIPHRMRSEPISYRSSHPSSAGISITEQSCSSRMNSTSYESFAQSRPTTRHSRSSPVTPSSVSTCSCRDHDCFPSSSTYVEDFKIQDADNQHIETLDTSQVPCEDSNVDMNSVLRSAVALAFGAEQARQESAQMAATTEKKNRFKIWRRKNSKKTCSSGKVSPRTSGDSAQSRNKGKAVAVDDGGTTADVDVAVDPKMDEAEDTENYIIRTGSPLNNSAAGSNRAWVDEDRVEAEMEERDPSVSHKRIDSAVEPVDGQGPIGIAQ